MNRKNCRWITFDCICTVMSLQTEALPEIEKKNAVQEMGNVPFVNYNRLT